MPCPKTIWTRTVVHPAHPIQRQRKLFLRLEKPRAWEGLVNFTLTKKKSSSSGIGVLEVLLTRPGFVD